MKYYKKRQFQSHLVPHAAVASRHVTWRHSWRASGGVTVSVTAAPERLMSATTSGCGRLRTGCPLMARMVSPTCSSPQRAAGEFGISCPKKIYISHFYLLKNKYCTFTVYITYNRRRDTNVKTFHRWRSASQEKKRNNNK